MADAPRPGSNFDTRETALLEAIWRGDELAAALAAAQAELATLRARLARAEEAVAELSEIGDAAQTAIDELRTRTAAAEAQAKLYFAQRDALAAEVFARARERPAGPDADGSGARRPGRSHGDWRRRSAAWLRKMWPRGKHRG